MRSVGGNDIRLLRNGVEYFPALEQAIDAAVSSIHLEAYIFEDDEAGRRIGDALKRAAGRGVHVHVLIDGFGSRLLPQAFIDDLRQSGVHLLHYRPERARFRFKRYRLRRLHRKVAVIDVDVAFVGGINVIDDYDSGLQPAPRFDYAVQIRGPLLGPIYRDATRLWRLAARTYLSREGWKPVKGKRVRVAPAGDLRAAFVVRSNLRHRADIEQAYMRAIRQAKTDILLANAYFLPGLPFRHALVDAVRRGVRVRLLLQGRIEYFLLHYATRALYGALIESGVEIYEYDKSFLHAKVAVIDDVWATVGSSNIDPFSLVLSREANVVIEDVGFARQLKTSLEHEIATGAHAIQADSWRAEPWIGRFISWASYGLVRSLMGMVGYAIAEVKAR